MLKNIIRETFEEPEYTRRQELLDIYSDVYKEKNGIRPRWIYDNFKDLTDEELEAELEDLYDSPDYTDYDEYEPYPTDPIELLELPPEGTVTPEEMKTVHPMEDMPSRGVFGMKHRARQRFHGPNPLKK